MSYVLPDGVENLTLTGGGNINGTGNGASNVIVGNDGNNTLAGLGGADTLTGGLGADTFVFGLDATGIATVTDFVPLSDGTFAPNGFSKDRNIIYPTFGLGLEHTISRHLRWEVKGSAFALPHRSTLVDSEATLALRFGRIEFIGGGKLYHFKTKVQDDNYVSGDVYGPYGGLRFYWKKQ